MMTRRIFLYKKNKSCICHNYWLFNLTHYKLYLSEAFQILKFLYLIFFNINYLAQIVNYYVRLRPRCNIIMSTLMTKYIWISVNTSTITFLMLGWIIVHILHVVHGTQMLVIFFSVMTDFDKWNACSGIVCRTCSST